MNNNFYKLHILGSRGTRSVFEDEFKEFGGETSCYIIKGNDDHAVIIDCGSGFYGAKDLLKGCKKIDILLTHVHYDHIIGLLDENIAPEDATYRFFGNFSKWSRGNVINDIFRKPFWPVNNIKGEIIDIKTDNTVRINNHIAFRAYPSNHPDDCNLYSIRIDDKKICILSDFENSDVFDTHIVSNADILVYDGMFDTDEYLKKRGWGHSSYLEGCNLAMKENVKQLIITHHSPYYDDKKLNEMENRCRSVFLNSRFARKGDVFII